MPRRAATPLRPSMGEVRDTQSSYLNEAGRGIETCTGRHRPTWPSCPSGSDSPKGTRTATGRAMFVELTGSWWSAVR